MRIRDSNAIKKFTIITNGRPIKISPISKNMLTKAYQKTGREEKDVFEKRTHVFWGTNKKQNVFRNEC
jgi:hypothetical protein